MRCADSCSATVRAASWLADKALVELSTDVAMRSVEVAASSVAFPMTLAVIRLTFQRDERPQALLIYSVVSAAGLLIALVAVVIEHFRDLPATVERLIPVKRA